MNTLPLTYAVSTKRRLFGESAATSAAYVLRTSATDPWTGRSVNHSDQAEDVLFAAMVGPDGIISITDPIAYFESIDVRETHKWAWVAREFIGSLPHLLELNSQTELALLSARSFAKKYDIIVMIVIHRAPPGGDKRNRHFHMQAGTRNIAGSKLPVLDKVTYSRTEIWKLRVEFADQTNAALCAAGMEARVDPRSYNEQGITKKPQKHRGQKKTRLMRKEARLDAELTALAMEILPPALMQELMSRQPEDEEVEAIGHAGSAYKILSKPNQAHADFIQFLRMLTATQPPQSAAAIVAFDWLTCFDAGTQAPTQATPASQLPSDSTTDISQDATPTATTEAEPKDAASINPIATPSGVEPIAPKTEPSPAITEPILPTPREPGVVHSNTEQTQEIPVTLATAEEASATPSIPVTAPPERVETPLPNAHQEVSPAPSIPPDIAQVQRPTSAQPAPADDKAAARPGSSLASRSPTKNASRPAKPKGVTPPKPDVEKTALTLIQLQLIITRSKFTPIECDQLRNARALIDRGEVRASDIFTLRLKQAEHLAEQAARDKGRTHDTSAPHGPGFQP